MQEINLAEETWDKKKIFLGVLASVVLIGAGYGLKTFVLDKYISKGSVKSTSIEREINSGTSKDESSSEQTNSLPLSSSKIQGEVERKLETIKQEIRTLNVVELASSSPQIQKIINEIKTIEKYPANQAKEMCENICKSL